MMLLLLDYYYYYYYYIYYTTTTTGIANAGILFVAYWLVLYSGAGGVNTIVETSSRSR